MKQVNPEDDAKFVVLKNLATREKFYTSLTNQNYEGHEVIAKVATHHEAQTVLFGREFADEERARRAARGEEE